MKRFGVLAFSLCVLTAVHPARGALEVKETRKSGETKAPVIDINRASAEDFARLPGIGPELARRIVAYRNKHGPFQRVEDLLAIRGMGPKKWRAIRPHLRVGPANKSTVQGKSERGAKASKNKRSLDEN